MLGTARAESDRFVFAIDNVRWREDIVRIVRRVLDLLSEPFVVLDQEVFVVANAGISQFPKEAGSPQALMKNAV